MNHETRHHEELCLPPACLSHTTEKEDCQIQVLTQGYVGVVPPGRQEATAG